MKISKTSKLGIVIIISLTILIWGINFLKGRDIFRTEKVYLARYKDVGGLEPSTVVQLNGLKIGYVRDIYFAEDYSGDLIVKIAVHNKFPLPKGTTAEIASSDLLGSKVVKLNLGQSKEFNQSNDTLPSVIQADLMQQVSEQLAPVKNKAEKLLVSLDSIVSSVSVILDSEAKANIAKSIEQISYTMSNLEMITRDLSTIVDNQKGNLSSSISNFNQLTHSLNSNSQKLNQILDNFNSISDSLSQSDIKSTVNNLNNTISEIQSMMSKVNSADGTLGMLVNDKRLYQNLNYTSENLNRLLVDLQQNPKKYVKFSAIDFGREVYVNPTEATYKGDTVHYRVLIYSSQSPVSNLSSLFQDIDNIEEVKTKNGYNYYSQPEKELEKIRVVLNKIQLSFPQATLKAFCNGNEISLKKVLKSSSK